jgi:hypothetical protein
VHVAIATVCWGGTKKEEEHTMNNTQPDPSQYFGGAEGAGGALGLTGAAAGGG